MSPQERFICELADRIRAGLLVVTGDLSVQDFGYSTFTFQELGSLTRYAAEPPDCFTLVAKLDCRNIHKEEV